MAKKLLIAGDVDPLLIAKVTADPRFDVTIRPVESEDELAAIVGDAEILVTRAYNKVTRRVLERAPRLTLIAQGTSGTDNIDEACARERGIRILSLPGGNANAVAELVIGYLIAMTRTIPAYTREVVRGLWQRDNCATRHELSHYTLGIVGLGQVGMRVARVARAFSMRVVAFDPYLSDADVTARNAERAGSLGELLPACRILTLHVPLTAETRQMIGAPQLAALADGSYVVNACRGEVLDQEAALASLASGHLAGLALDVFDPEPPLSGFPDDPRLILTPHIAGCTFEAKASIGLKLYELL
ncbi:MAG: D-3-phosphoglycerate dehydrogenase [Acidobacteria bacterium]|nr:D-3-phosphoglycerate dehydrogenase [Acidobacteriota bacterium]